MPNPLLDLTGRVAIITGGGTGIGRATAKVLTSHGAGVVLASRRMQNLEAVADEVRALGGKPLPIQTDVRDPESVEAMVRRAVEELGRIDILVNNAGGNRRIRLEEVPLKVWDNMINLNLRGPFLCAQAAVKVMMEQGTGGSIINISSGASRNGTWGVAPYGAAKAGLNHLTNLMAGEWGQYGVRVNCLALGAIKTEGFVRNRDELKQDADTMAARNALRRNGRPEEVAQVILFLASEASSFVTGETFAVNGGPHFDFSGA